MSHLTNLAWAYLATGWFVAAYYAAEGMRFRQVMTNMVFFYIAVLWPWVVAYDAKLRAENKKPKE